MKLDEILKHLESIKIDEDENYEIAKYIAQKLSVDKLATFIYYIMTKDKKIHTIDSYKGLFKNGEISPSNAHVFIENHYLIGYNSTEYFYPFLEGIYLLLYAYLSKLGLKDDFYHVVPATGLKFAAMATHLSHGKQRKLVVEIVDIDTVAINTNLKILIHNILGKIRGTNDIYDDVIDEAISKLSSQKLFAGYNFNEARDIINSYYAFQETSLAKDVEAIKYAYNRIFEPFRVEYDLKTRQFVVKSRSFTESL